MKFRSKIITLVSAAAVLAVAVAIAAFAGGFELGTPRPDKVFSQPYTFAPATAEPAPVSAVYYTEKGNYFHSIPDCSGMQGASAHDPGDAFASGKGACPVCVDLEEILPYTTAAVTAEPTPPPTLMPNHSANGPSSVFLTYPTAMPTLEPVRAGSDVVYCTKNGTYYHAYADCSGMMNARSTLPEQAEADGKLPCPVCLAADANAWFSGSATPEPTPEPVELRYDLEAHNTLTPMPAPVDVRLSATESISETETFRALFGMDFSEAFPDYTLETLESWTFDSGYIHSTFTNGESSVSIDENSSGSDQDGMLSISIADGAAAFKLMKNAPEPLRTIYMDLAPDLIENTLAAAGRNTAQARRLGDINLLYSYDMKVTNAEFTYYMNDGSIVHIGYATPGDTPELYLLQWEA